MAKIMPVVYSALAVMAFLFAVKGIPTSWMASDAS